MNNNLTKINIKNKKCFESFLNSNTGNSNRNTDDSIFSQGDYFYIDLDIVINNLKRNHLIIYYGYRRFLSHYANEKVIYISSKPLFYSKHVINSFIGANVHNRSGENFSIKNYIIIKNEIIIEQIYNLFSHNFDYYKNILFELKDRAFDRDSTFNIAFGDIFDINFKYLTLLNINKIKKILNKTFYNDMMLLSNNLILEIFSISNTDTNKIKNVENLEKIINLINI